MSYNAEERALLNEIALQSIKSGLQQGRPMNLDLKALPEKLQQPGAAFVTLNKNGHLRGCIGSLEARRALAEDVAQNAFAAAFRDPRFAPLQASELDDLEPHISVLGKPEPMQFGSEQDLIRQLKPGKDGLILEDGHHRGTFLPSVWESLPEPASFVRHLKQKAGLPPDYWSDSLKVSRYGTESWTA
ncbi:MAG: AMMECR1 domain-containing protein [Gammaproteobacteria bacterium]|nr:MAG: AMMECR1 domain-containing protein [Gammaproteobacteria bacterium]